MKLMDKRSDKPKEMSIDDILQLYEDAVVEIHVRHKATEKERAYMDKHHGTVDYHIEKHKECREEIKRRIEQI